MFSWLRRRKSSDGMPQYSRIQETPSRGLPSDLREKEKGDEHLARSDAFKRHLDDPARRPALDTPLFVTLVPVYGAGALTISSCLLTFSSPLRVADYLRTALTHDFRVKYLVSSPRQFVSFLGDLRGNGIDHFTVDRCPRCDVFTAFASASVTTADEAVGAWSVFKSTELARLDLYLEHALESARGGRLEEARDVALETVAHVSMEDPRTHLLLGQIGVALGDGELLLEARSFLCFLKATQWGNRLEEDARSGSTSFGTVAS